MTQLVNNQRADGEGPGAKKARVGGAFSSGNWPAINCTPLRTIPNMASSKKDASPEEMKLARYLRGSSYEL